MSGLLGGALGYHMLKRLGHADVRDGVCDGSAYRHRSKLDTLFGPDFWRLIADRIVIDFGCGGGREAIEMAARGARRVVGVEIRDDLRQAARAAAAVAGVSDRCEFVAATPDRADLVISLDSFEHFADPPRTLALMRQLVRDDGRVLISFGPPWLHPYGGHLFSVFPWAHVLFTERALLRWRADFKHDGATRFCEVAGGLNQMTVGRFLRLLREADFITTRFEAVPIRRLHGLWTPLTRELFTSIVRCQLAPRRRDGAS